MGRKDETATSGGQGVTKVTAEFEMPSPEAAQEAAKLVGQARWSWPYLARTLSVAKNGRETGCFIAGYVFAAGMHGAPGLRVAIRAAHLAGCVGTLVDAGIGVVPFSYSEDTDGARMVTLDVWVDGGVDDGLPGFGQG